MKNRRFTKEELIAGLKEDEEWADQILFKTYKSPLAGFLQKQFKEKFDYEEIGDIVVLSLCKFIKVVRNNNYRQEASIMTLLCTIAINEASDQLGKKKRNPELYTNIDNLDEKAEEYSTRQENSNTVTKNGISKLLDMSANVDNDPLKILIEKESRQVAKNVIEQLIEQLPDNELEEILLLRYFHDFAPQDIMKRYDISHHETVRRKIKKALNLLRDILARIEKQ